ncbi:MAG TPA: nucleotide exchange factor GrpE [Gemmatimonadales bacterium]|nr:nucleotide exchange factor GrpE [Gemmatimonadales bacterium]
MTEPKGSPENENAAQEGGSAPPPVELPDAALERVTEELSALKDKYLRSAAEFENFRKRTAKERVEVWAKAQGELIERLVDGLDDLNRFAEVDQATTDAKTLHDGVELVRKKFWKALDNVGLIRIDQTGVPFDPKVHEAVTMGTATAPEQDHTVGSVLQAGYRLGDALIRPARVMVLSWKGEQS